MKKFFQLPVLNKTWLNKPGISLVEVLITLSIFVLLVGIIVAPSHYFHALAVHMNIDTLFARCMALQRAALATQRDHYLDFDPVHNTYTDGTTLYQLPPGVCFGIRAGVAGPPSNPCKPLVHPITFKNNRITFHASGIIDAGTVYMVHQKSRTMYALSSPIAQFSFLRKYRYDGRWQIV